VSAVHSMQHKASGKMNHKHKAYNVPPGIDILHHLSGRRSYTWYKASVLVLTFLCYAGYHASRKPPSIVKSVLKGEGNIVASTAPGNGRNLLEDQKTAVTSQAGWAPFNEEGGQALLGGVDLAFLGTYAIGMFFAGHLGDRMDLRRFLSAGMLGSGVFTALFGLGYVWDVHLFSYYVLVSIIAGLFQSTGWPSVVSIVANWSGKGKRGLIMGIWNAHTSVGNIVGTVTAAALLSWGWGWSFMMLGFMMIALSALMYFFLVVHPSDIGLPGPDGADYEKPSAHGSESHESINFWDAWRIPGVLSYALCLFFAKLIAYTFLYWLPFYIKSTPIQDQLLTPKEAGDLSVLFDVGGVAGGVIAGHLSDRSGASAIVSMSFTMLSIPVLWMYRNFGHTSFSINVSLMMLGGFFVNGPYALITTAVSADLGTHESLQGNSKALATVSAIIDGMGSIGAALGPMLTGYITSRGGFDMVFVMLYLSAGTAGLMLSKIAAREFFSMSRPRR